MKKGCRTMVDVQYIVCLSSTICVCRAIVDPMCEAETSRQTGSITQREREINRDKSG